MLLVISDASVLIDIECGALTSAMFSLPWQFAVPDILFAEELEEHHPHLLELGLISKPLNEKLIVEMYHLRQQYKKTSLHDLSALVLAKQENCQLLTSDKALRDVAQQFNIEVHGTLWLVEQMIIHKKITCEVASIAFERMRDLGSRLPWVSVERMLQNEEINS